MEDQVPIGSVINDPFRRVVIRVASFMISEPKFYESAESRVASIKEDLQQILLLEPEFIAKLAYYSRNELNLRSTSNFLAAWAATKPETHTHLAKFFSYIINLPSDLLDFVERYQELTENQGKPKFSSFLQTLIKRKFCDFSEYQLGKYCSEGKRKRALAKGIDKKKLTMKYLVRACHIKRPANLVMAVLGKKYPSTAEAFAESSLSENSVFKPEMAGKRMKIATPVTWEVTLSEQGNKAECWEHLIKSNKLPFMAMLRNLRNLLVTGVDEVTHRKVTEKLRNPDVIANSRLFPFRFLSAYESIKVDLDYLENIKRDPNYVAQPAHADDGQHPGRGYPRGRGGRIGLSRSESTPARPQKKPKIPAHVPTQEILDAYNSSIEEAIRLATALNISPLRGHTVIFCDCSGSMSCPISSGSFGSVRTCCDVGYLFGQMIRKVSESSEVILFSSPRGAGNDCWLKLDFESENIFESIEHMKKMAEQLGGGTDYPASWFRQAVEKKVWVDNLILFSDMIISQSNDPFARSGSLNAGDGEENSYAVVEKYRKAVNPNMRYVTVDLAGHSRKMTGAAFENDFKNIVIGGYSDAILKLVSTTQTSQEQAVRDCKPVKRGAGDS